MSETLLVEEGRITTITLNRPDRHNALDTAMGDALVDALERAGRSSEVKVVVLRGAGRSFCSGDDVSEVEAYHNDDIEAFGVARHPYFRLMSTIRRVPKPVVAQVHGNCLGSAMDLMLASDFAIAASDAKLQMVFGFRGIVSGVVFLPKYVGLKTTNRLLFDPNPIPPAQALELGLLTSVSEPGDLDRDVAALAEGLAGLGDQHHAYFGLMKDLVNRSLFPMLEDDVQATASMVRLSDFYRLAHLPATVSS